jgi:hypothetical protein
MRVHDEPSMRAANFPVSLGQRIRDQEMWRVTRILNTPTTERRKTTYVERYADTPFGTGRAKARTTSTARRRFRSLLP